MLNSALLILLLIKNGVSAKTNNLILPPSSQEGNACLVVIFPEHDIDGSAYVELGKSAFVAISMHLNAIVSRIFFYNLADNHTLYVVM